MSWGGMYPPLPSKLPSLVDEFRTRTGFGLS